MTFPTLLPQIYSYIYMGFPSSTIFYYVLVLLSQFLVDATKKKGAFKLEVATPQTLSTVTARKENINSSCHSINIQDFILDLFSK